jgi:3-oxoacyl-[acyl-carrier protein] reductase
VKRIVLITGSSRGIGRAFALRFARAGDTVVINYRVRDQEAAKTCRDVKKLGSDGAVICADVRSWSAVQDLFGEIRKRFGGLDVLVNNAGVAGGGPLLKMPPDAFDDVLAVNLKGAFLCARAAGRIMMSRKGGHIINISSYLGVHGAAGGSDYAASKAGLIALGKSAAKELGPFNVCVNTVLPGFILTEMGASNPPEFIERVKQQNCLGRLSDIGEAADFVYELSLKRNISGQVFNLDSRIL